MRLALAVLAIAAYLPAADLAIPAKGAPAFTVTAPEGWSTIAGPDGVTTLATAQKHPHIQVWAVPGKRTVDEAAADLAAIASPQVKDFAVVERSDVSIAGAKALVLVGTGTEADDGDPANAQATVFSVGGTVWILLSHGEGDGAAERARDVAALLRTVSPAAH